MRSAQSPDTVTRRCVEEQAADVQHDAYDNTGSETAARSAGLVVKLQSSLKRVVICVAKSRKTHRRREAELAAESSCV